MKLYQLAEIIAIIITILADICFLSMYKFPISPFVANLLAVTLMILPFKLIEQISKARKAV